MIVKIITVKLVLKALIDLTVLIFFNGFELFNLTVQLRFLCFLIKPLDMFLYLNNKTVI